MRNAYLNAREVAADKFTSMPGRGALIVCTVAGNVAVKFAGGAIVPYPVVVGANHIDDVALVGFTATGTTATSTVYLLD